jgi:hypothetical protein
MVELNGYTYEKYEVVFSYPEFRGDGTYVCVGTATLEQDGLVAVIEVEEKDVKTAYNELMELVDEYIKTTEGRLENDTGQYLVE